MSPPDCTSRRHFLLRFLAWLFLCLLMLPSSSLAQYRKQLLVLHSYHQGYKWTDDTTKGIIEGLQDGGATVNVHIEYMDTKRISSPEYFQLLYDLYRVKFWYSRFDAIVSADSDAFRFLMQYRDRLFPGVPIVFCGVYDFQPALLQGNRGITGVNERADFRGTLDLILKLHPKARQVVVINDVTSVGTLVHQDLLRAIPFYQGKLEFRFLENLTMEELLAAVRKLPDNAVVLYTAFLRDRLNRTYNYDESISMISQRCPVPIYGVWDFNLGFGIVGGKLISGYFQGKNAGTRALRVLQGEPVESIPVLMNSRDHYMFDYHQLRRFDIDLSALPSKSIFINRPANFYTMDRSVFWSGVGVFITLVLVILVLMLNIRSRKMAEVGLRSLTQELERRVAERTDELERRGVALRQQNEELQRTYHDLQAETAERVRAMEELRNKDRMLIQQTRMAAVGEMLANIAHQWRQPLNVLGLTLQEIDLIQRRGALTQEWLSERVQRAMDIIQHMSHTIDDFRIFSTPDQEKVDFRVSEVIRRIVSLVEGNFRAQGVAIEIENGEDLTCCGYPNSYSQVLLNILVNARDAIQERRVSEGRIRIRSWVEEDRTVLSVTDNGGGIKPEIMDRIFDAYFTTKPPGKGTGIGLFMSKALIEKSMGGELSARNTADGAEFRISLPCGLDKWPQE